MIELTLTDEQARIVSRACEFYARIVMGQFKEIIWECICIRAGKNDDICQRCDEAERLLFEARKQIYPELHGPGHSYGIGKFERADKAFDVHQVIRYAMGHWRTPFSYHELPKCVYRKE